MKRLICTLALAGAVVGAAASLPPVRAEEKASGAEACLAKLKSLAGDWTWKDPSSGKDTLLARYRVTGGGSTVEEVLFPGAAHEMVTMYHLDGDRLVLTHYCAGGTQPKMRATTASTPAKMEFECVSVGNVKSHDEGHMHHAVIQIQDSNHFSAEWASQANGKPGHVAKFSATRKGA